MTPAPGVGLVVVSHSFTLARAAVELAREMLHGEPLRIEVAAGLADGELGTDAVQIAEAIQAADAGAGVVVLMDLGSAVLSAEMALDFLGDDDARAAVVLCPAPFVEGLVVAAVTAAAGASRDVVAAEASAALDGKLAHLAQAPAHAAGPTGRPAQAAASSTGEFVVTHAHGLHARPAARLVQEVRALGADVTLRNLTTGAGPADGASLSSVAALGARQGHHVEVAVSGRGAADGLDRILALARRGFDEPDHAARQAAPPAESAAPSPPRGAHAGQPAAPGLGIGPARAVPPASNATELGATELGAASREAATDPAGEWERLHAALATVSGVVAQTRARTAAHLGSSAAAIFDAHQQVLDDPALLRDARSRIDAGLPARAAWAAAVSGAEAQLAALADPYLRARAFDVRAVGDQVLRAVAGAPERRVPREGVLLGQDLTPAEAAALEPGAVRAVVLAGGSPLAHNVILARAKGIPMVVAAGPSILATPDGATVAVDGDTGEVAVDPDPATLDRLRAAHDR